jgi:hypothetical protein
MGIARRASSNVFPAVGGEDGGFESGEAALESPIPPFSSMIGGQAGCLRREDLLMFDSSNVRRGAR